ncbi:hypothetical protein CTAYLR_000317 [Chrysophaeum taylorii]|uniref:Uncharacterized protein n=1 Tax=Chrysophaeum taylorii TaxID=2483200 RepID=A0AAD7UGQ0_9STRA|nr:hypothetical protein CTAYLR_000317 [Chrysophaeum taylorii]
MSRRLTIAVPEGTLAGTRLRVQDPETGTLFEALVPADNLDMLMVQVPEEPVQNVIHAEPALPPQPVSVMSPPAEDGPGVCDDACQRECAFFSGCYACVVGACAVGGSFLSTCGLVLLAISPATVIWGFAERWHGKVVTRCTLLDVSSEATLFLLVPLLAAISLLDYFLPMRTSCDASRSIPFWRYFFTAYVRAALLEEMLKYAAVRRQLFKAYVVDARAMLVYSGWAGATFGVLENVTYAFILPVGAVVLRSILTVPLHASTGIQIGANLSHFRFADDANVDDILAQTWGEAILYHARTYVTSTWGPTLVHGTYDLLLFIAAGECKSWTAALVLAAYVLLVVQFFYVRTRVVDVERRYPKDDAVDVHKLIENGEIPRPCPCCCCGHPCCACCY